MYHYVARYLIIFMYRRRILCTLYGAVDFYISDFFLELTELEYPQANNGLTIQITVWSMGGFSNRARVFLFKFYNNILGLNTRISHFVPDQSRACTFCSITGNINPVPDESFIHLFFTCETSANWHIQFLSKYFPHLVTMNRVQRAGFFFLGKIPAMDKDNLFIICAVLLFQFCIWEEKLRKKEPSFRTIENIYLELLSSLVEQSNAVRECAEKINFPICRAVGVRGAGVLIPAAVPGFPQQQQPPWIPALPDRGRLPAP
jgi:hypothetical protein